MPIAVYCQCGNSYSLRDEYAGMMVQCPKCGANIRAELQQQSIQKQADPAFERDKFLLRQKYLSVSEKYYVWDEYGQTIMFIERPAHFLRNLLAILAGISAGAVVFVLIAFISDLFSSPDLQTLIFVIGFIGVIAATLIIATMLSAKRDVTFYRDESKQERLLEIIQEEKFQLPNATYTIRDNAGNMLARLRKNYLYDVIRKRWYCTGPDGGIICIAKEDSVILSLLRRVIGPLYGLLRTNFIILKGTSENVIGEFNRKFTILDRYVLDLSRDSGRSIDRRIALALGVMLDTGERR